MKYWAADSDRDTDWNPRSLKSSCEREKKVGYSSRYFTPTMTLGIWKQITSFKVPIARLPPGQALHSMCSPSTCQPKSPLHWRFSGSSSISHSSLLFPQMYGRLTRMNISATLVLHHIYVLDSQWQTNGHFLQELLGISFLVLSRIPQTWTELGWYICHIEILWAVQL